MGLISFIILAALIGLLVWAVTKYIPMPSQIKTLILVAALIVLVLILLAAMGVLDNDVRIPEIN